VTKMSAPSMFNQFSNCVKKYSHQCSDLFVLIRYLMLNSDHQNLAWQYHYSPMLTDYFAATRLPFLKIFLDIWWRYGNHLIEQWCVGKDSLVEYYFGIVFEFVANNRINDPWLDDHQYFASHWMAIVLGVIPVFSTLDDHFDHKRFLFWSLKMVWFSTKSEGSIFYLPFGLLINDGGLATKLSIVKLVLVIFRIVF